jgi:hypothetical protein
MARTISFADSFPRLLQEMPDNLTLPQWQYLYREVILLMGMRILELFPEDALGANPFTVAPPPPPPPPSPPPTTTVHPVTTRPAGGSHGPGYEPSIAVAVAALGLQTPTTGKQS